MPDMPRKQQTRNKYHDDCRMCQEIRNAGGFGPSHDASENCESGGHSHCSCDTCF